MCKIRVIIKNEDKGILCDKVYEIETNLNPFDRPTYVEIEKKKRNIITFYYTGSSEKYVKYAINPDLEISYGIVSGRISQFSTIHNRVEGTDRYAITKELVSPEVSPRFTNNVKEGLTLLDSLLQLSPK